MLSCKDNELMAESGCKDRGGGGQQRYLSTVKIENFRQILMSCLKVGGP